MEDDVDITHNELLALAQSFVAQAKPIAREQERLAAHLIQHAQDSRLARRLLATVATASDALVEQEAIIEQLNQSGEGDKVALREAS